MTQIAKVAVFTANTKQFLATFGVEYRIRVVDLGNGQGRLEKMLLPELEGSIQQLADMPAELKSGGGMISISVGSDLYTEFTDIFHNNSIPFSVEFRNPS